MMLNFIWHMHTHMLTAHAMVTWLWVRTCRTCTNGQSWVQKAFKALQWRAAKRSRRAVKDQWTAHPLEKKKKMREDKGRRGGCEAVLNEERQPPAGCCCWKLDKSEQTWAAGSSNLSPAVPPCVTSLPSLGTGARPGVFTLQTLPEDDVPL